MVSLVCLASCGKGRVENLENLSFVLSRHSDNMPGPCNAKKKRRQQGLKEKQKLRQISVSVLHPDQLDASIVLEDQKVEEAEGKENTGQSITVSNVGDAPGSTLEHYVHHPSSTLHDSSTSLPNLDTTNRPAPTHSELGPTPVNHPQSYDANANTDAELSTSAVLPQTGLESPFISDPGNGPRVKDAGAFLASFFCPAPSLEDEACAAFARTGVLHVLEAVLPKEVALVSVASHILVLLTLTEDFGTACCA